MILTFPDNQDPQMSHTHKENKTFCLKNNRKVCRYNQHSTFHLVTGNSFYWDLNFLC